MPAGTLPAWAPAPGGCHLRGQLPDPACTPGSTNPAVTPATIATTICRSGWTATVRPPVSYTEDLKRRGMVAYGFSDPISAHEEDHLIPLELGGAPADPWNLWPEPGRAPNPKDSIESQLRDLVCTGQVPLLKAQLAIAADWTTAVQVAQS